MRAALGIGSLVALFLWVGCDSGSSDGGGSGTGGAGTGATGSGATGSGATGSGATGSGATGSGATGSGAASGTGGASSSTGPGIVVDQFGYRPADEKIAVVRDPRTGFDAGTEPLTPAANYQLVDAATDEAVYEGPATPWNNGAEDASSGDVAYWFDFSSVTTPGEYYVLDAEHDIRSDSFRIADDVYKEVLKQAVRTFFYQRVGFAKEAEFAGANWADAASHVGALQDKNARLFSAKGDASTEKDLSGGWYDAGDYNKYTNWTANYVIELLRAYRERPSAFGDDYDIPESGNGTPDIVDEARFGMDHLKRLQDTDGSVISIVGLSAASPPSATTGPSVYGPASTSATLSAAAAFAYGSRVFRELGDDAYADDLQTRAEDAWDWAEANPAVVFKNNDSASGSQGVGAGQQEVDDNGRKMKKLAAAVQLFAITNDAKYQTYFDENYDNSGYSVLTGYVAAWEAEHHETYLDYTELPDATPAVVTDFLDAFKAGMQGTDNFGQLTAKQDPYLSHIADYTWGSNAHKSRTGLLFYSYVTHDIDQAKLEDAQRIAERYVHYIHGVNPLGLVYLSNMGEFGAGNSVTQFYHSWFNEGTDWDQVGVSAKGGPPPGFLTGGPNPSYDWDGCCAGQSCGAGNNEKCEMLSPPLGQPKQKSYLDFNDGWPLNSWAVTENSNGYQVAYIRLLSKFVTAE